MKKTLLFLAIMSAACFLNSCTSENDATETPSVVTSQSKKLKELNDFSHNFVLEMHNNVFQNGNYDIEKEKEILVKCAYNSTRIDVTSAFNNAITRSENNNCLEIHRAELSEQQYAIIKELTMLEKPTIVDIINLKKKVYQLKENEQDKVLFIFDAIESVVTGFENGLLDMPQTRSHALGCNLATGAVGACAGFLAGCMGGPIAAYVVSWSVSAVLSTYAC